MSDCKSWIKSDKVGCFLNKFGEYQIKVTIRSMVVYWRSHQRSAVFHATLGVQKDNYLKAEKWLEWVKQPIDESLTLEESQTLSV